MPRRQRRSEKNSRERKRPTVSTEPTGTLRVIAGRLRGRQIEYLGDPRTRPMKQRVREAAFNLLGTRVVGTHVIDLFAGTGALAWEALSRGALSATLLERHFPSARTIRANATALGLADKIEVVAGDTFFWARQLDPNKASPEPNRHWLIFCSPPYELYVSGTESLCGLIRQMVDIAPPESLVVVESDNRFDMELLPDSMVWDIRKYPPAILAVAQKPANERDG